MRYVIGYHDNCSDGFTAAWAARRGLLALGHEVLCVPLIHGPEAVESLDFEADGQAHLMIVDFCPSADALQMLGDRYQSVTVLDHHVSAQRSLADEPLPLNVSVTFDMNRSGAGMAWDHFFPTRCALVDYVEDGDLWRFKQPDAKAILAVIHSAPHTFDRWDTFERDLSHTEGRANASRTGHALLAFQDALVERVAKDAMTAEIAGYRVPCVNSPVMRSELGNVLAKGAPFSAVWYQYEPGKFGVSLRSDKDNPDAADVSEIARKFGGGGHKNAAGFTMAAPPTVLGW